MKITGADTRMIEIAPGEWAHVRGKAIDLKIEYDDGFDVEGIDDCCLGRVIHLLGKRVLILELAE